MTENNRPRHLHDLTAEMPAIPRAPKHAAPRTGEQQQVPARPYPPVPVEWRPRVIRRPAWYQRAWRWLMGA